MDLPSRHIVLTLLEQIIEWREKEFLSSYYSTFRWTTLHLSIVRDYFLNLSKTCDFRKLPFAKLFDQIFGYAGPGSSRIRAKIAASFTQELQEFFMVPRLNKFHESENRIKKYQLVEAFISFLLQLLYHKTDPIIGPCKDRVENLEKELRFLLTILGDAPLMLCDEHEEFQKLLAEFEAVANEAGSLVHSLFFSTDRGFGKKGEGIGVVLNHIDRLNANTMNFLNLLSSIRRSTYINPKTSVVDSLLIIDSLICDLEDLMSREDNPIADVKDQINMLHHRLTFLKSSIKDIGPLQPSEIGELKEPLMRIGDMAHEAEYLIITFVVGEAPFWYLITRLTDVNHKIELIGTELQKITKKYKFGGLKVAKYLSAQVSLHDKRHTEVDDVTVGFEDAATDILDQLVGGTEHLQVISIFGMPGLGKTTLAKKLYNNPSVNYRFDKLSWCVVSQTYQRQSLLTKILVHIATELEKDEILKMEEEILVENIYKTLKGRRYLIAMDDIWDSNVWDDLRRCFPDDGNGSRILFTTRNKDVAPPHSKIYELPSLSNDQCWELLEKKVFDNKPCPPELLGIGKKIAANCRGLPLTVVIIAGILSTIDKEKSVWEAVGGNLASYILDANSVGDNSVMQILELSYEHLPDHLKPCFLYFGAFPEDKEIRVREVTSLWISEGFIRNEEEKSTENIAEGYLMELIDKSLVMVAKRRSDGGVKACVIHDLLHDLCLKRSEEENFLKFVKSDDYSIYKKGHRRQALGLGYYSVKESYCQHVRSFHGRRLSSPFYVRDMRLLRALHFDSIDSHLIGIGFLVFLRYLVIGSLPESISNLVNLEYLHVKNIVYLLPAIMKMRKLRYLHVRKGTGYDKDCNSSQTNNLEFLSGVRIEDEEMLKCSPHLRKLKYTCEKPKWANLHVDLRFLTQLESLKIKLIGCPIEEISFPSTIRKLTLSSSWLLWETISSSWLPWEKMSIIGKLENLEVLKLESSARKGWDTRDGVMVGKRWDTRDGEFQKLIFLKLGKIDITQWNVDSSEHFPKLQRLVLIDCCYLQEIPCEIGEIPTLQLIEVKGRCLESLVVSAQTIQQEQLDNGNQELGVVVSATKVVRAHSSDESI